MEQPQLILNIKPLETFSNTQKVKDASIIFENVSFAYEQGGNALVLIAVTTYIQYNGTFL